MKTGTLGLAGERGTSASIAWSSITGLTRHQERKWVRWLLITGPGSSLMRQGFPVGRFWTSPLASAGYLGLQHHCQDTVEEFGHGQRWIASEPSRKSLRRKVKWEEKKNGGMGRETGNILRIYYWSVLQVHSICFSDMISWAQSSNYLTASCSTLEPLSLAMGTRHRPPRMRTLMCAGCSLRLGAENGRASVYTPSLNCGIPRTFGMLSCSKVFAQ